MIAEHVPNRQWDVQRWVATVRRAKGGSREAYWRLWGLTHFLTCSTCDSAFPVCELDMCAPATARLSRRPAHSSPPDDLWLLSCSPLIALRMTSDLPHDDL